MPWSDNRLRPEVLQFLSGHHVDSWWPNTVLDVGCGGGSNLEFYKPWWPNSHWTAIEVYPPYISMFDLFYRYDSLYVDDVRNLQNFNYDLVIFGDVIEHLHKEEGFAVLRRALDQAKYVVVALPVTHYPQGEMHGNVHETHLSDWTYEELSSMDECVFAARNDVTGSFVLKGKA